ncbi:hypothetical protein JOC85_000941 [Bacillus mesophilus]|uniref:Uncharacterized protein n=1 Tax=Bacillus mesophilus TaxID=1808955 RepID=A0A6M0QBX0_9BACI|nr:hypothetical protein [Bacillus mesophilus]MBM7660174.1 hypothetical protein [Bacillus mesophilus]NEY73825.1 hypothetical protein [Bacillus mesophilus]
MFMYSQRLYDATTKVFNTMSRVFGTNTFFIALNDGKTNRVVNAFNKNSNLIQAGTEINFEETY